MHMSVLWGTALIMVGTSIILDKLYGISIPFEILFGIVLILFGLSLIVNTKRHCP